MVVEREDGTCCEVLVNSLADVVINDDVVPIGGKIIWPPDEIVPATCDSAVDVVIPLENVTVDCPISDFGKALMDDGTDTEVAEEGGTP